MRPQEFYTEVPLMVTIEVSPHLGKIWREGYSALDFFADIGGLQSLLVSLFGFVIGILNYNHFDNFMVSRLFKVEIESEHRDGISELDGDSYWKRHEFLNYRDMSSLKMWCTAKCGLCCPHSRSRLEKAFKLGRHKLQIETNIIEILKSRRYTSAALKLLLSPDMRKKLKERTRYYPIKQEHIEDMRAELDQTAA
jgi:hypothetical protein